MLINSCLLKAVFHFNRTVPYRTETWRIPLSCELSGRTYDFRTKENATFRYGTVGVENGLKAGFPLGDFFRAKRLFPLLASLITSANAMPTKEKVASREKSRLVENGLKGWQEHRCQTFTHAYVCSRNNNNQS